MIHGRNMHYNAIQKHIINDPRRGESFTSKTLANSPKISFIQGSSPAIRILSLDQQRANRKNMPTGSSAPQSRSALELRASHEAVTSLQKQWKNIKETLNTLHQNNTVNSSSIIFSPLPSPKYEDITIRTEPHIQCVKQFTIRANYLQMRNKHIIPVTTINLSPKEQEKVNSSDQKSTENSIVGDCISRERNRSYEVHAHKSSDKAINLIHKKCPEVKIVIEKIKKTVYNKAVKVRQSEKSVVKKIFK